MRTVLIADDHEMPRAVLSQILAERLGFGRILEAASLDAAYDLLDAEAGIGLALFDLDMPGVGNVVVLREVRVLYPDLKVAIVSGSQRREDMLGALAAGLHGFVPKSLRLDAIETAIRWILDGQIYAPPMLAVPPPPETASLAAPLELSDRQRDVLHELRLGRSNKEIARSLGLGLGTVKVHVAAVLRILGASGRHEAVALAGERDIR